MEWLLLAKFAANNAVFDSSKMTLFFANKGFHLKLSLDISQSTDNKKAYNIVKNMEDIYK